MATTSSTTRTLGVLSIATNVYLRYWMDLAQSIDRHVRVFDSVTLHVFTDQAKEAREFASTLKHCSVKVHEIEPLRWPEATLFRYKIFAEHSASFSEDFLMYLDADTIVNRDLERDLPQQLQESGILLVEQAGSWRPRNGARLIRFFALHPGAIFEDTRKIIVEGGRGTWERRRQSAAFVERSLRKTYVTGAVWMGTREAMLGMIRELAERVTLDWNDGIIAVWHDESHLNWWNAHYRPRLLDPRYYFFPGQRHLDELPNIIALIRKDEITR